MPRWSAGRDAANGALRAAAVLHADGVECFVRGRYREAAESFERALAGCRAAAGARHPDTLTAEGNLGVAYVAAGEQRTGIRVLAENLAARERTFGDTDPRTLTAGAGWKT